MTPYAHPPTPGEVGVLLSVLGLPAAPVELHSQQGDVNRTFFAGDLVVRIAINEEAEADWSTEGLAHPYATRIGVPTPLLLFHGRDGLGRAATIVQRVPGRNLAEIDAPEDDIWGQLGTALAMLHNSPGPADPEGVLDVHGVEELDPAMIPVSLRSLAEELASDADATGTTYIHGDVTHSNLMRRDDGVLFLIDWGDAGYGHAAYDFATAPPLALPTAWRAYEAAGGRVYEEFRRRVIALHFRYAFHPSFRNDRHRRWLSESAKFLRHLVFGD